MFIAGHSQGVIVWGLRAAFLLVLTSVSAAHVETLTGRVVPISDGDTLTVLVKKGQVK